MLGVGTGFLAVFGFFCDATQDHLRYVREMREGDACVRGAWRPWSVLVIAAANMDVCVYVYIYI